MSAENWDVVFDGEPNFPRDVAILVLTELQDAYGAEFARLYPVRQDQKPGEWMEAMIRTTQKTLEGLTPKDVRNGLDKFRREAWVINLPKFRSICEQGGSWLTEQEAWVSALAFASDPNAPVTEQAKQAYDAVRQILNQEGQKAAANAFRDIYSRIVTNCKNAPVPVKQTWHVAQKAIQHVESTGKRAPMPANVRAQFNGFLNGVKS